MRGAARASRIGQASKGAPPERPNQAAIIAVANDPSLSEGEKRVRIVFFEYDENANGFLDCKELRNALSR